MPRSTLVRALQGVADVYSTNGSEQPFIEAAASAGDNGFTVTGGKPLADAAMAAIERRAAAACLTAHHCRVS